MREIAAHGNYSPRSHPTVSSGPAVFHAAASQLRFCLGSTPVYSHGTSRQLEFGQQSPVHFVSGGCDATEHQPDPGAMAAAPDSCPLQRADFHLRRLQGAHSDPVVWRRSQAGRGRDPAGEGRSTPLFEAEWGDANVTPDQLQLHIRKLSRGGAALDSRD